MKSVFTERQQLVEDLQAARQDLKEAIADYLTLKGGVIPERYKMAGDRIRRAESSVTLSELAQYGRECQARVLDLKGQLELFDKRESEESMGPRGPTVPVVEEEGEDSRHDSRGYRGRRAER